MSARSIVKELGEWLLKVARKETRKAVNEAAEEAAKQTPKAAIKAVPVRAPRLYLEAVPTSPEARMAALRRKIPRPVDTEKLMSRIKARFNAAAYKQFNRAGIENKTIRELVTALSKHENLYLNENLFSNAVKTLAELPLGFRKRFLELPENAQRFMLRSTESIDDVYETITKIEVIERAGRRAELDYVKDPSVLNKSIAEITRIVQKAKQIAKHTVSIVAKNNRENLVILDSVRTQMGKAELRRYAAVFEDKIDDLLEAIRKHGDRPIMDFKYPGVTPRSNVRGTLSLDLGKGRAIFFLREGRMHLIFIGTHDDEIRFLETLLGKTINKLYPPERFRPAA